MSLKQVIIFFQILVSFSVIAQQQLTCAGHAHNDYMHKRPLFEALESRFTSIEIDVYLHNNKLIVSHDAVGLDSKPTIEELYLDPIKKIITEHKGSVYEDNPHPVIFMIDCKTGGDETYNKLKEVLAKYKDILAVYQGDKVIKAGPIHILISGNKPYQQLAKEESSFMTIDADIGSLGNRQYDHIITRYSDPWEKYFTWKGFGAMPNHQKAKLDSLIHQAHGLGKDIRFYHIPDKPTVWLLLLKEGVDLINTDKLQQFMAFYNQHYYCHDTPTPVHALPKVR